METNLIYSSNCNFKSFWQTYKIFSDRLELDSLLGKMTIPFENIEKAIKQESDVKELFKGHLNLKGFRPALKLDWSNFTEHITVDKTDGLVHRILFTPDNVDEFMSKLNEAMMNYNLNIK